MLIFNRPFIRRSPGIGALLLAGAFAAPSIYANPTGATVAQGTAAFSSSGSTLTIQTSDKAFINWQSFNIGLGETTTFVQPSSSSLVWNQINGANPSQILGNLNANGYVVLQNSAGFYIGGQAVINTHGLIMTTAPIPMPDLSSGGAWQFNAPPPTASIINYGQINVAGGAPAFLIASDIENNGLINAPGGNIGLYAGQQVLVSERPDGRGLSAAVTLPQGSVNNSGKLIADAGTIEMNAQVVNQGGLVQANSIQEVNGVIQLVAGDSLNVGATSVISAKGDSTGASAGGSVTLKSGNQYTDNAGSVIDISGGAQGGNGGQLEISAPQINSLQSSIVGHASAGYAAGSFLLDPQNIQLTTTGNTAPANGMVNPGDPPTTGTLNVNVNLLNSYISQNQLSQITLQAVQNIEVSTAWSLPASSNPNALLKLVAGGSISLDDGASIGGGQNWSISLSAGPTTLTSPPAPMTDGIYLNGGASGSYIQTQNGNITVWAANEVLIAQSQNSGSAIRTLAGGNISVTAAFGDVNTGGNMSGYLFQNTAPYHTVSSSVGGISTAAGGNVTINAGQDVTSYLPYNGSAIADIGEDAGTGAFGTQPGNVTINAGGSVYGHYVLANGVGTITAQDNVGGSSTGDTVALSLIAGSWTLNAPNGNIYLQEVRNPNGIFNNAPLGRGATGLNPDHYFDYDPQASVTLNAGDGIELLTTQSNLPRGTAAIPAIFPPSLYLNAGAGGVLLGDQLTLFPSAYGELNINITGGGSLTGSLANAGNTGYVELLMSDSALKNYVNTTSFTDADHGPTPFELDNPNPVIVNVSGNINNVQLVTVKETDINVGGNVVNSSFFGQNLHPSDKTVINVAGTIFNSPSFSSVVLAEDPTLVAVDDLPPGVADQFDILLKLAVDPVKVSQLVVPAGTPNSILLNDWDGLLLIGGGNFLEPSNFAYDPATRTLSYLGQIGSTLYNLLNAPTITVVRFSINGLPEVDSTGHFVTDTYSWVAASSLQTLIAESAATTANVNNFNNGLRIGGPGEFDVNAGSLELGNSLGILSVGALDYGGSTRYANLASLTPVGADLNVTAQNNFDLVTSTIASLAGGNVSLKSTDGEIDLGSAAALYGNRNLPLGAWVTGNGSINVMAYGDVNIDSSRIAAYDGGDVTVTSQTGNVNAGNGGATAAAVETHFVNPQTGVAGEYTVSIYGNGILATTLDNPSAVPGGATAPGNITVTTPEGDIIANLGGILQEALNGNIAGGPTVTLDAGTFPGNGIKGYAGNVDLGESGVIGGTIIVNANGNISGLIISSQNSVVNAAQNFSGTVLSGGSATVSAATAGGTIVAAGGATVTGTVTAQVLSQNASVNGSTTSTLGTTATATSTSTAAAGASSAEAREQTTGTNTTDNATGLGKNLPVLARLVSRVTVILPK